MLGCHIWLPNRNTFDFGTSRPGYETREPVASALRLPQHRSGEAAVWPQSRRSFASDAPLCVPGWPLALGLGEWWGCRHASHDQRLSFYSRQRDFCA
jgi:hypothetical protein